MGKKAFWGELH